MAINEPKWRKVADISEISEGGARSVELDEGRIIALFNDAGNFTRPTISVLTWVIR